MKTILLTFLATATLVAASEPIVTPVGISVSTLQRDSRGQPVNPLSPETSRPEPLMLVGAVLAPGTQVSLLIDLPDDILAIASSSGANTSGIKLASLIDSTGKDLIKLPEGGVASDPFWHGNRGVLVKTDNNRLFIVALGTRAPQVGAISVKGELLLDVSRGKVLTAERPFSPIGNISLGKDILLSWGKGSPRPAMTGNSVVPPPPQPTGRQLSTTFSQINKSIVKIEIVDAQNNNVVTVTPERNTEHGITFSDGGKGPYKIVVSYLDPNAGIEKMPITFEVGLGVSQN